MVNISSWAIKNPVATLVLFLFLSLAGWFSFRALPVQDFPDIDLPSVTVTASLPGATPSQVETEITRKIEDSISTLGSIQHIQSIVNEGTSSTTVMFELEKNSQEAVDDVRDAVSRVRSDLPQDVQEPVITKVKSTGQALITYAVYSKNMSESDLSWFVDNSVSKVLLAVPGVAQITRQGGVSREIQINLNAEKVKSLNVAVSTIASQIKASQLDVPGGTAKSDETHQSIRVVGLVKNIQDIENILIPLPDGRHIKLSEIATVEDKSADRSQIALLDGKAVVGFQIYRSLGQSELTVADKSREAMAQLAQTSGVEIREVANTVNRVKSNYNSSMMAMYEGAILAVLTILLFLRDWRATLVSAVALPLSVLPTFYAMKLMGFSLNGVTLLALTLIVGVLVDDAIVEVENIVRHLRMGKKPYEAAMDAALEIGLAVIATSLTLVAVFLPTAFMGGVPGKIFKQFGWTTAIAVLVSLLVARLLTPMMAAYLLKKPTKEHTDGFVMTNYLKLAGLCLKNPYITLALAGVFFYFSMGIAKTLPFSFMPRDDRGQIVVSVEAAPGSTLEQTTAILEKAAKASESIPEVKGIYVAIGSSNASSMTQGQGSLAEIRKGSITLTLKPKSERVKDQTDVEKDLRQRLQAVPAAKFTFTGGGSGEKYSVVLSGDDPAMLAKTAEEIEKQVRTLPGLGNIQSSASLVKPEVRVTPDLAKASDMGVSVSAIGQTLRIATNGDYSQNLPKFNLPERQIPIKVKMSDTLEQDLTSIGKLGVPSKNGTVPLNTVATLTEDSGPSQIDRFDRNRNVIISIELNGQALGNVSAAVDALPIMQNLPPGVHRAAYGEAERMKELFGGFGLAMATGILCIYAVLVLLFKNFVQPVTILMALPLSAGGAFWALSAFGYALSLPTLIGLVLLMGIVTKNSILLVEYALVSQQERGMGRRESLLDACHKRARPIFMTTVAMIMGMLPMAFGLGDNLSFRMPMAIVVIGGLTTSTVLSLLVVPVVFEVVDDIRNLIGNLFKKFKRG